MITTYNKNAIAELCNRGYHNRHIAIVMGCVEDTVARVRREIKAIEPTLKFLTMEQKQRLFVLDKMLQLKPTGTRWSSNDYYYITILVFLLVPKEQIKTIFRSAPQIQVSQACRELAPKLQLFDYKTINVTSEEYRLFVEQCYKIIANPEKWK